MRATIYFDGTRRWSTDDGAWMLALREGDRITYPDDRDLRPYDDPVIRRAMIRHRSVDLFKRMIVFHVEIDWEAYDGERKTPVLPLDPSLSPPEVGDYFIGGCKGPPDDA